MPAGSNTTKGDDSQANAPENTEVALPLPILSGRRCGIKLGRAIFSISERNWNQGSP
jgi:hypothetical protein